MRKFWGQRDDDEDEDDEFFEDMEDDLPLPPRRPGSRPGAPGGRPGGRPGSGLPGSRPTGGLPGGDRPGSGLPDRLPGRSRPGQVLPGSSRHGGPRSRYERLKRIKLDMSMIADPLPYLAVLPQSDDDEEEAAWVEGVRAAAEQMIPGEFVIEARVLEDRFGEVLGQLPRLMNDPDATELIRMAKVATAMTLSKLMGPQQTLQVIKQTTVPVALVLAGYLIARNDLLTEDPDLADFDPDELV